MTERILNLQKQFNCLQVNLIEKYRNLSTIDSKEFKELAFGINHEYRNKIINLLLNNKHIFKPFQAEQTRAQKRKESAQQLLFYVKNIPVSQQESIKNPNAITVCSNIFYIYSPALQIKYAVTYFLYYKTIYSLGTKVHQSFLNRAYTLQDIGCFALTELTHGSNVRGILTEAHYDHQNKSFIIHSPSKQAMKFWIGAAANLATMCIVWAQLYINGKCYGVHAYIVPIRDKKTYELLPGILIGDCGPKLGKDSIDNGFMMFDRVRIPKQNQLNKIAGVDQNGNYISTISNPDKTFGLQMGTLSGGRVQITTGITGVAIAALSIAIRYTLCRRQFSPPKSNQEVFLFQYPLTKHRLIPLLAQTIVHLFGGQELSYTWDTNLKNLLNPKNKIIGELHAISSSLKPKSSWFNAHLLSQCRQMLGGHGYSAYSRLGAYYDDNEVNLTYEGDNTVLLQQTVKYILDNARKLMKGKQIEAKTLQFLKNPPQISLITLEKLKCLDFLELIISKLISEKFTEMTEKLILLKGEGLTDDEVWNRSQAYLGIPLALYYGDLYYLQACKRKLLKMKSICNQKVFSNCIRLWVWKTLQKEKYGNHQTRKMIKLLIQQGCQDLAKEAVGLLDTLAVPSELIGSPFADENGLGMKKYLNLIYSQKDTFRKVQWSGILTKQR